MLVPLLMLLAFVQGPQKQTLTGAANVTRVDASLMCAGATTPEAFPEIRKQGFRSIINLRLADEPGVDIPAARQAAEAIGLRYVHVPIDRADPSPASIEAFLEAVSDRANQPMYIHCGSANRVAAMWLVKRVVVDGWEQPRAVAEAEAIGLTSPALKKVALDYIARRRR